LVINSISVVQIEDMKQNLPDYLYLTIFIVIGDENYYEKFNIVNSCKRPYKST